MLNVLDIGVVTMGAVGAGAPLKIWSKGLDSPVQLAVIIYSALRTDLIHTNFTSKGIRAPIVLINAQVSNVFVFEFLAVHSPKGRQGKF